MTTRRRISPSTYPFASHLALAVVAAWLAGCTVFVNPGPTPRAESRWDPADPVLNQRRIFVVGEITSTSAAEVIRQLRFLDARDHQPIDLYLMTPGGDFTAAAAIERTLRTLDAKVNTHALGECNSCGAMLLAAGTGLRQAFPDSVIVLHGLVAKNRPPARYVELTQGAYTDFWRRHARLPEGWLPIPPGHLRVLSAREALQFGLIDQIVERP